MKKTEERQHIPYTFRVTGMQCASCGELIREELSDLSYVSAVEVSYENHTVTITGDFVGIPPEALAEDFTYMLAEFGFTLECS